MSEILNALPGVAIPAAMFYFFFWRPFKRIRSARAWRETPCVIVSSSVDEDTNDSGLYRIAVTYEYRVAGRTYHSSRYSFSYLITAGSLGKKRVVRRLAPGSTAVCYVNPVDPTDAVIKRGITWDMVLSLMFAGVFLVVFVVFFINGPRE